jgi:TetR/AcrR family transcriptional repressor of nem operon
MSRAGRPRTFGLQDAAARARELFWQRGYSATSLRDLAKAVGVRTGSLYAAFGDKHDLFLRALTDYAREAATVREDFDLDEPVLPQMRGFLAGALAAAGSHPGRGCMLGNTAAELLPDDAAVATVVREGFAALERALEVAIQHGQTTGEIRADIAGRIQARLLVTLVQGLHVVARAQENPDSLIDIVDGAVEALRPPG